MIGIYMIHNKVNGKIYIGQSIDIEDRFSKHKWKLENNKHPNDHLQKSYNKYGKEEFEFIIIEECLEDDLDNKEVYWISYFESLNREYGYNKREGGKTGKITEEAREKLRGINLGKTISQEARNKISQKLKGIKRSEEFKINVSEKLKGRVWTEEHKRKVTESLRKIWLGKHLSEEHKLKISLANKGKFRSEETKQKMKESMTHEIRERLSEMNSGENNPMHGKVGELNPSAKITEKDALQIIDMLLQGYRIIDICKKMNIKRSTVGNIKYKKKWKYLTQDIDFTTAS